MSAYQKGLLDLEAVKAVQLAMLTHCELMGDRVAILDPPPGLNAQQIREWRVDQAGYDSKYATLYWPWIKVFDPATRQERVRAAERRTWPASGAATTTRAACTRRRPTRSSAAPSTSRSTSRRREHDLLNPDGINCIRSFPGRGIRVWGARTLSSDPSWRYLNVRRLFNYIEESILERHPVGRLRAERPRPLAARQAHDQRVPAGRLAGRRAVRRDAGAGLLRQVRRGDQPAGRRRRGQVVCRDRHRAGQAGGVRRVPSRPVLGRRGRQRVTRREEHGAT